MRCTAGSALIHTFVAMHGTVWSTGGADPERCLSAACIEWAMSEWEEDLPEISHTCDYTNILRDQLVMAGLRRHLVRPAGIFQWLQTMPSPTAAGTGGGKRRPNQWWTEGWAKTESPPLPTWGWMGGLAVFLGVRLKQSRTHFPRINIMNMSSRCVIFLVKSRGAWRRKKVIFPVHPKPVPSFPGRCRCCGQISQRNLRKNLHGSLHPLQS